jgi:hypothetical protein
MAIRIRRSAPILASGFACTLAALLAVLPLVSQSLPAQRTAARAPFAGTARAPRDLARRVARNESLIRELRDQYTFRQDFRFEELADNGRRTGFYHEVRDVVFSPAAERAEVLVSGPNNSLSRIRLTKEDFQDVRDIQNFLFTEDVLWLYQVRHRGEERIDGEDCWVMQVTPRNELQGMRFFEGLLWVSKKDEEIVRAHGKAVPEIRTSKSENLFPLFTTLRTKIDGHWMPASTVADDELPFSSGRQRVRLQVEFANYKRFGAETSIQFGEPQEPK